MKSAENPNIRVGGKKLVTSWFPMVYKKASLSHVRCLRMCFCTIRTPDPPPAMEMLFNCKNRACWLRFVSDHRRKQASQTLRWCQTVSVYFLRSRLFSDERGQSKQHYVLLWRRHQFSVLPACTNTNTITWWQRGGQPNRRAPLRTLAVGTKRCVNSSYPWRWAWWWLY